MTITISSFASYCSSCQRAWFLEETEGTHEGCWAASWTWSCCKVQGFLFLLWVHSSVWFIHITRFQPTKCKPLSIGSLFFLTHPGVFFLFNESGIFVLHFWGRYMRESQQWQSQSIVLIVGVSPVLGESPAIYHPEQTGDDQEQKCLFWHCLKLFVILGKLLNIVKTD